jgi:teichuronic acid biosynthesis glycosyltransferase TuaC
MVAGLDDAGFGSINTIRIDFQLYMHILFVARGHGGLFDITSFIKSQGTSLQHAGIKLSYFLIRGKGLKAYFFNIRRLRNTIFTKNPDIIHAHYSLCGLSALLARTKKPIVLSLMGSDVFGEYYSQHKITWQSRIVVQITQIILPQFQAVISKNELISRQVPENICKHTIPNGVDLDCLLSSDVKSIKNELGLDDKKRYIVFLNNPANKWKNFKLAQDAISLLDDPDIILLCPYPIRHNNVSKYLQIADLLISTSFMEGSPNTIKEAMACNCPVVATDVGDIRWLFGDEPGHFLTSFDPVDVAQKIKEAILFIRTVGRTNGRNRLIELGLDMHTVAFKLIEIYKSLLKNG